MGIYILIGVLAIVVFFLVGAYNKLVSLKNALQNAWAQVDVQLKRRHDLIPNVIESVKGYMNHERELLESITRYRSQALNATGISEKIDAEIGLESALNRFNVVVEKYPELKANQGFLLLHEELTSSENKIAFARQSYNDQVYLLNSQIEMFPSNIVAGMFNFTKARYFEIAESEREVPKVSFS